MGSKNSFIKKAVHAADTQRRHYAGCGKMLTYLFHELVVSRPDDSERAEVFRAYMVLNGALRQKEERAARDLFMWSGVAPALTESASLKMLAERFAEGGIRWQVMDLLQDRDVPLGAYYDADEKAFRAEVKAALARKEKSDAR